MKLKTMNIHRGYGEEAPLRGSISFSTDHGDVTLRLTDEECRPILDHCASAVVAASRRVAESITSEALATTAIEHKPEGAL